MNITTTAQEMNERTETERSDAATKATRAALREIAKSGTPDDLRAVARWIAEVAANATRIGDTAFVAELYSQTDPKRYRRKTRDQFSVVGFSNGHWKTAADATDREDAHAKINELRAQEPQIAFRISVERTHPSAE